MEKVFLAFLNSQLKTVVGPWNFCVQHTSCVFQFPNVEQLGIEYPRLKPFHMEYNLKQLRLLIESFHQTRKRKLEELSILRPFA